MRYRMIVPFVWLLILCGCSSPTVPSAIATPTVPQANTSPSSAPSSATLSATQQATSGDNGTIVGVLLDETGQPITDLGIFAANVSDGPSSEGKVITFQLSSSKRGLTDKQGKFTISDVPPGTYSLVFWTPNTSAPIPEPGGEQGSAIQIEVKQGEVMNVGTLKIKRPT